jgi:integrase
MRGEAEGSVRQFAYHLKYWWTHLNRQRVAWDSVSDFTVIGWREELLRRGCDERTVNAYISTVFRFYLWAEKRGHTHGLIGEPDLECNIHPPLSVDVKFGPRESKFYVSPLLKRTTPQPILPTPTNDEITKVHETLAELSRGDVGLFIRDTLALSWMEQTGTRRSEVLTVTVRNIPKWDEIYVLQETGEKKEITIVGKGNKRRSIWAGADLLSQTREYIEEERRAIVNRCRARLGTSFKEPREIFLSSKTGLPLTPDSLSQKLAKAFRKAGVSGSGHRVRARFLTNLVSNTFECEFERQGSIPDLTSILLPVAQIAGHSRVESLQPYVAIAKKRSLKQTRAERAATVEEREIAAKRRLSTTLAALSRVKDLRDLVRAVESGNKARIKSELLRILKAFD